MVEPLKKDDVFSVLPCYLKEYKMGLSVPVVEVSRIKELLDEYFVFITNNEDGYKEKFIDLFGVLFDSQSPKSRDLELEDRDKPPQSSKPSVGVASYKKPKAFGGMRSASRGGKI